MVLDIYSLTYTYKFIRITIYFFFHALISNYLDEFCKQIVKLDLTICFCNTSVL